MKRKEIENNRENMNIGDYVRTKKGILKIKDDRPFKDDKNKLNYLTYENYSCVLKENIIKSSHNIIDLIEVGDYVNGYRVDAIGDKYVIFYDGDGDIEVFDADIKSIVTHEEFESMEYRL